MFSATFTYEDMYITCADVVTVYQEMDGSMHELPQSLADNQIEHAEGWDIVKLYPVTKGIPIGVRCENVYGQGGIIASFTSGEVRGIIVCNVTNLYQFSIFFATLGHCSDVY